MLRFFGLIYLWVWKLMLLWVVWLVEWVKSVEFMVLW